MTLRMRESDFVRHLDELRRSLIRSIIGLVITTVLSLVFISPLIKLLSKPYTDYLASAGLSTVAVLRSLAPADTISVTLKTAIIFGLGLASPWIIYQMWSFVAPGLYKNEKRYAGVFCSSVIIFFVGGVVFAYLAVLPTAISFFYKYSVSMGIAPDWTITNYLGFVATFLVSFGVVFEMPVAIATLAWLGLTNSRWLASYRRHAIVVIFIIAAIFTPPDVISQLAMGIPMVILYEVSILAAKMIEKVRGSNGKD